MLLVFGSLYIHIFVFCIGKACRCLLRSGDWHCRWRISHFFGVKNSWIAFAVSLWFLAICTVKHCLRLNLSRKFSSVHCPVRLFNQQSDHQSTPVAQFLCSPTCPHHNITCTMFDSWCSMLQIVSGFFSHHSGRSLFWFHVSKELFSELCRLS